MKQHPKALLRVLHLFFNLEILLTIPNRNHNFVEFLRPVSRLRIIKKFEKKLRREIEK